MYSSGLMKFKDLRRPFKNSLDEIAAMHQIPRRSGQIRKKEQKWE